MPSAVGLSTAAIDTCVQTREVWTVFVSHLFRADFAGSLWRLCPNNGQSDPALS